MMPVDDDIKGEILYDAVHRAAMVPRYNGREVGDPYYYERYTACDCLRLGLAYLRERGRYPRPYHCRPECHLPSKQTILRHFSTIQAFHAALAAAQEA